MFANDFPALLLLFAVTMHAAWGQAVTTFDDRAQQAMAHVQTDPSQAALLYRQLLTERPQWAEGWFYLGASYFGEKQYKDAQAAFQKAATFEPKKGTVWAFLGLSEYELGQYPAALDDIGRGETLGLADDPQFIAAVRNHGALVCLRRSDFACSVDQLRPLATHGNDAGQTIELLGMSVLAVPYSEKPVEKDKEAEIQLAGKSAWNLFASRSAEASSLSAELVARYPTQPGVHYLRGLFLLGRDPEDALIEFQKERRISPSYGPVYVQIAILLFRQQRYSEALPIARRGLELNPKSALGHLVLGRILLDQKKTAEAIPEFKTATALDPENAVAHFYLAKAFRAAGKDDEARREKTRFEELNASKNPNLPDLGPIPEAKP